MLSFALIFYVFKVEIYVLNSFDKKFFQIFEFYWLPSKSKNFRNNFKFIQIMKTFIDFQQPYTCCIESKEKSIALFEKVKK